MKANKILDAMNCIDDDLIHEADEVRAGAKPVVKKKAKVTAIWGAIAAAAVVLVVGGVVLLTMNDSVKKSSDATMAFAADKAESPAADRAADNGNYIEGVDEVNTGARETAAAADEVEEAEDVEEVDGLVPYFDPIDYDIDNDGVIETCTIGFGPTSGLFSLNLTARVNGDVKYSDMFVICLSCYSIGFEAVDDALYIVFDDISLKVYVEDGHIVIGDMEANNIHRMG